ncbi:MAG: type II toxin-antitoxin system RelE/ParE family toxin [Oscillospiraceae bacterium]|nr:type II toxin-antitoxin system RelE/ParE family toxin [Oscillospiraceae bacterium]
MNDENINYSVIYSPQAMKDMDAIYSYISGDLLSAKAAVRIIGKIESQVESLAMFPESHPKVEWEPWASKGVRKVPVENFIIYYLPDESTQVLRISRIVYGGRNVDSVVYPDVE